MPYVWAALGAKKSNFQATENPCIMYTYSYCFKVVWCSDYEVFEREKEKKSAWYIQQRQGPNTRSVQLP